MTIAWGNPAALLGLVALAGPIVAHLLRRHRADRVRFPSLRFIAASPLGSVRLHPPSDLLLLVARMGVVGLAVAALAQPLLVTASRLETWNRRMARAVVVDVSESMRAAPAAKEAADAAAAEAGGGASVVVRVDDGDLRAGLRRAVAGLSTVPPARREIVVISDMQIASLARVDLDVVPASVGLRFVQVGTLPDERRFSGMSLLAPPGVRPQPSRRPGSDPGRWVTHSGLQEIALAGASTGVRVSSSPGSMGGLTLVGGDDNDDALDGLVRAVATAGAPAPSAEQPLVVRFSGARPVGAVEPVRAGWMLETVRRLEVDLRKDEEVADPARETDAPVDASVERPWFVVSRDRQRRTLVRAAAAGPALVLEVAAGPSAFLSAAVVRGALLARRGIPAQPEQEVQRISAAELTRWSRVALPVPAEVWTTSGISDGRWCWGLVILMLGVETWMRRGPRTSHREAAANAA